VTRTTPEVVKKTANTLTELQTFLLRKTDKLSGDVPAESNEGRYEEKMVIPFFFMPRDAQRLNAAQHFSTVIVVEEVPITKRTCGGRGAEDFEVILIFWDRRYALSVPDINNSVGNHARVATGAGRTERMGVINQKFIWTTLDDQPRLMRW
jgi:hypothetical protein